MESGTEFKRLFYAAVKSRYFFLVVSCACLLCWVLSEELTNYGLIASGLGPDWRKDLGRILGWMLLPAAALFPLGICFATRTWLLSEKWLLLFLETLIIAPVLCFGYQNPYVDPPFYDRPFLRFLEEMCIAFVAGAVFQGIPIAVLHFFTREKGDVPLWRKIVSNTAAILLTVLTLILFQHLTDMVC